MTATPDTRHRRSFAEAEHEAAAAIEASLASATASTLTPRLAKPIDPNNVKLPTDSFIEPSDRDFYFFGRMEGRAPEQSETPSGTEDGTEGSYGQDVNW